MAQSPTSKSLAISQTTLGSSSESAPPPSEHKLCCICTKVDFTQFLPYGYRYEKLEDGSWYPINKKVWVRYPNGRVAPAPTSTSIDFDRDEQAVVELGSLGDIISRSKSCLLCSLAIKVLQDATHPPDFEEKIDSDWRRYHIFRERVGSVKSINSSSTQWREWKVVRLVIGSKSVDISGPNPVDYSISLRGGFGVAQLGHSLETLTSKLNIPSLLGRFRPVRCDIALLKSWLDQCCTTHTHFACRTSTSIGSIRLINVEKRQLQTFPNFTASPVQYLTLSYVWGQSQQESALTRGKLQHYHTSNSLKQLPRTIEDAMSLVSKLGHIFLWVDSLCILQDDENDKRMQIPMMAAIYNRSVLTIIAAFGDDSDAGLPGIGFDRQERLHVDVGDFTVISGTPTQPLYANPEYYTTWNTRAWTFQEYILSIRCLIFLNHEVYWRCPDTEWHEETDFEDSSAQFYRGYSKEHHSTELTEEDVLNAFSGILEAIPSEFFWGLPCSTFGKFLAWGVGPDQKEDGLVSRRRFEGCPSWSWMAWKWSSIKISFWPISRSVQSLVSAYRFRHNGLQEFSQPDVISFKAQHTKPNCVLEHIIWTNSSDYACSMEDIPKTVSLNETYVVFWTYVIDLPADKERKIEGQLDPEEFRAYALINIEGTFLYLLDLSWHAGIARREGRVIWRNEKWDMKKARKMLVILG
ncbi:HET domain containing protein [Hyaloscypha variabilis]